MKGVFEDKIILKVSLHECNYVHIVHIDVM